MKSRLIVFSAVLSSLAWGSHLCAQDIGPNSIPDGEYWLELRGKVKGADKVVESKRAVTAVIKNTTF